MVRHNVTFLLLFSVLVFACVPVEEEPLIIPASQTDNFGTPPSSASLVPNESGATPLHPSPSMEQPIENSDVVVTLAGKTIVPRQLSLSVGQKVQFVNTDGLLYRITCYSLGIDGSKDLYRTGTRLTTKQSKDSVTFTQEGHFGCLEVVRGNWIEIDVTRTPSMTGLAVLTPLHTTKFTVFSLIMSFIIIFGIRKLWCL